MTPGSNANAFSRSARPSLRVVVVTITIISLVYTVLYQALLAPSLMVRSGVDLEALPYDVLRRLDADQTVIFQSRSSHFVHVTAADDAFNRLVRRASIGGVPRVVEHVSSIVDAVVNDGHVWMAPTRTLIRVAGAFTDAQCRSLRFAKLPEAERVWTAFALSPNISAALIEHINFLVTQRANFDVAVDDRLQLSRVCRSQLFAHTDTRMRYYALDLATISGVFWVCLGLVVVAIVTLVVEIAVDAARAIDQPASTTTIVRVPFVVHGEQQPEWFDEAIDDLQRRLVEETNSRTL